MLKVKRLIELSGSLWLFIAAWLMSLRLLKAFGVYRFAVDEPLVLYRFAVDEPTAVDGLRRLSLR